jgi:hypothetical protein
MEDIRQKNVRPELEFKPTNFHKGFIAIRNGIISAIFIAIIYSTLMADLNLAIKYVVFVLASAITGVFLFYLVDVFYYTLTIHPEKIIVKRLKDNDIIYLKDIKAFKRNKNGYVELIPIDSTRDLITIEHTFNKQEELLQFFGLTLINLDQEALDLAKQEALSNPDLGVSPPLREEKLKEVKKPSNYINYAGAAIAFWVMLYPKPYDAAILTAMLFPVGVAAIIIVYKGTIKLNAEDEKPYPNLSYSATAPGAALALRAFLDFEILSYPTWLWYCLGIVSLTLSTAFLRSTKEINFKAWSDLAAVLYLSFMLYMYLYGAYMMMNCEYDSSKPQVFTTLVSDKEISSGKHTSYYLRLEPWGPRIYSENVRVTSTQYEAIAIGDVIHVHLYSGALKSPWFLVSKK